MLKDRYIVLKKGQSLFVLDNDTKEVLYKIGRRSACRTLGRLSKLLSKIDCLVSEISEKNGELYYLLKNEILDAPVIDITDSSDFSRKNNIANIQETLDEIKSAPKVTVLPKENILVTLESLGYNNMYFHVSRFWYEKVLEDTDEKEVTEEIQEVNGQMLRRIRTTLWEATPYGKSSTSITYRKLRNTKRLENAFSVSYQIYKDKYLGKNKRP